MNEPKRFAVAGAAGRMGREIIRAILEAGHEISGASEAPGTGNHDQDIALLAGLGAPIGKTPVTDPVEAASGAHLWIDFTTPQATLAALEGLKHTSVQGVVIGTTGFSAREEAEIAAASAHFAIVKAGNFSLGVNLLAAVTRIVANRLNEGWDAEILETHHRRKRDAPSGTALMLAEAVAAGRGVALEKVRRQPYSGSDDRRAPAEIGFAVRRAGGVVGEHEALFASETEIVSLSHTALNRSVFADGALTAALWAADQPPGLYDMQDVLGLTQIRAD